MEKEKLECPVSGVRCATNHRSNRRQLPANRRRFPPRFFT